MAEPKRLPAGQHTVVVGGTLRMKEFRQMVAAEKSGDLEQLYPWLVRLVREWTVTDEAGEPLPVTVESMDELTLAEFKAISGAVGDYIKGELEGKN